MVWFTDFNSKKGEKGCCTVEEFNKSFKKGEAFKKELPEPDLR